jgi:hypothetical protein
MCCTPGGVRCTHHDLSRWPQTADVTLHHHEPEVVTLQLQHITHTYIMTRQMVYSVCNMQPRDEENKLPCECSVSGLCISDLEIAWFKRGLWFVESKNLPISISRPCDSACLCAAPPSASLQSLDPGFFFYLPFEGDAWPHSLPHPAARPPHLCPLPSCLSVLSSQPQAP